MTIDPKQKIAGCSLLRIRDFVRRYLNRVFDVRAVANSLVVKEAAAAEILEWLEANKFIERVASATPPIRWTGTDHAGTLANASAGKKIDRATADRLLRELLERATRVNEEGEFAFYVKRIVVWGSYLGTETKIGDLDVAVELGRGESNAALQQQREEKRVAAAHAAGRVMKSFLEQIYWPQEEVFRFLRGSSRSYHFVPPDDRIFQQAPQKTVFEANKTDLR